MEKCRLHEQAASSRCSFLCELLSAVLARLIGYAAGSLAGGLAGTLALAAAALFSGSLKVRLVNSNNVLQKNTSFFCPFCFASSIITHCQKFCNRVRGFFSKSSAYFFSKNPLRNFFQKPRRCFRKAKRRTKTARRDCAN